MPLPRAADGLAIPFVASGGMADGRSLVAALARGANLRFDDTIDEVACTSPRIMLDGVMDGGTWICGAVTGPIRDSPTVKALIDRVMAEADRPAPRALGRGGP